ncbi:hypothetical protein BC826DRAFT_970619 [Russula brevipes]|nr:hypothetical protein BC826DRAFT_970619 [Russula brevipes]
MASSLQGRGNGEQRVRRPSEKQQQLMLLLISLQLRRTIHKLKGVQTEAENRRRKEAGSYSHAPGHRMFDTSSAGYHPRGLPVPCTESGPVFDSRRVKASAARNTIATRSQLDHDWSDDESIGVPCQDDDTQQMNIELDWAFGQDDEYSGISTGPVTEPLPMGLTEGCTTIGTLD